MRCFVVYVSCLKKPTRLISVQERTKYNLYKKLSFSSIFLSVSIKLPRENNPNGVTAAATGLFGLSITTLKCRVLFYFDDEKENWIKQNADFRLFMSSKCPVRYFPFANCREIKNLFVSAWNGLSPGTCITSPIYFSLWWKHWVK